MTRFVPGDRLLEQLDAELRKVLRDNGLNPLRADDKMYMRDRNLWNNVCVYMLSCKTGISILEDRIADEFNPNVALEYGFMRALDKPVLLLADVGFRNLRADIIGTLREQFDITDIAGTIRSPIEKWLKELDKP
jgi:nucleoside 2-deoxyribosyltransferase